MAPLGRSVQSASTQRSAPARIRLRPQTESSVRNTWLIVSCMVLSFARLHQPASSRALAVVHTATILYKHLHISFYSPQAARMKEGMRAIGSIAAQLR